VGSQQLLELHTQLALQQWLAINSEKRKGLWFCMSLSRQGLGSASKICGSRFWVLKFMRIRIQGLGHFSFIPKVNVFTY
jgi:hypothetical protein